MPNHQLDHIREISQSARGIWFTLLALLGFVGVVMMAHDDADFFAVGVATTLPVFAVEVPTVAFFIAAPLLIAAFYVYLQIYLTGLWDAVADAPARIDGDRLLDRVHPTLLAQTAVLYRARRRRDGAAPTRAFSGAMLAISVLLVWLTSPALLALMLWRSAAYHHLALTAFIALCCATAVLFGWEGLLVARGVLGSRARADMHAPWRWPGKAAAGLFVLVMFVIGALLSSGSDKLLTSLDIPGAPAGVDLTGIGPLTADLREAELTRRPADWRSWPLWMEDFEQRFREREGIPPADPLGTKESAFRAEAAERYADYIRALSAPDLQFADLRGANLILAFLPGADLRGAEMQGANLSGAEIQNARCASAMRHAVADARTRLPRGLTLPTCLAVAEADLPDAIRDAIAHHPETTDDLFRITRSAFLDALLCDEGELPLRVLGTWVPRGDGAWVDDLSGNVFAEHPYGAWRETPADDAPPMAAAGTEN